MEVEYVCFGSLSGYAIAAKNYILALKNHHLRIHTLDCQHRIDVAGKDLKLFEKLAKNKVSEDAVQIYHCIAPMQRRRKNRYNRTIGVATFETSAPPKHWIEILNQNTAVLAPSLHNVEVFKEAGVTVPIFHIPHCIDLEEYHPVDLVGSGSKFTFLFIGSWRRRKGYEELLTAWGEEFTEDEDVQLLIKTDKTDKARSYINNRPGIIIEEQVITENKMPDFIRSVNCLILPTKGEGFGLPCIQAMACGIPVIVTDCTGCKDYANDSTAFLLKPEGIVKKRVMDNIPQFFNKEWAFVSVCQIRKMMRFIFESTLEIQKTEAALSLVKSRFSLGYVSGLFDRMFNQIF